jgi:hypothetical protein
MSKLRLAKALADATGSTVDEAAQVVDDIGQGRARAVLNNVENATPWKIPALAGVGVGGGLLYREQSVDRAEAAADQAEAVRDVLNSDSLSKEEKQRLAEQLAGDSGGQDDNGGGGDDPLSFLTGGGIEGMLFKIIVVVVVLNLVLNWSEGLGNEIEVGR